MPKWVSERCVRSECFAMSNGCLGVFDSVKANSGELVVVQELFFT